MKKIIIFLAINKHFVISLLKNSFAMYISQIYQNKFLSINNNHYNLIKLILIIDKSTMNIVSIFRALFITFLTLQNLNKIVLSTIIDYCDCWLFCNFDQIVEFVIYLLLIIKNTSIYFIYSKFYYILIKNHLRIINSLLLLEFYIRFFNAYIFYRIKY